MNHQILLVIRNQKKFNGGTFQSESNNGDLNEKSLVMLKIISHDINDYLVSMVTTLKLLTRGYYGKMDDTVSEKIKDLLSKTINLIGVTKEHQSRTF